MHEVELAWKQNRLFAALPDADRSRLIPSLEILTFFTKETVHDDAEEIHYAFFPLDCIVALISCVDQTSTLEVGLIGNEGMINAPVLMGAKHSINQALILVEGKALRLPASVLKKEAKRSSRLREGLLVYANSLLVQSSQLAACHRYHTPKARLARLFLTIDDRAKTAELHLTQDLLARLLATRRATVTQAANQLQEEGVIKYVRGRIRFLDRKGLEKQSCGCYAVLALPENR